MQLVCASRESWFSCETLDENMIRTKNDNKIDLPGVRVMLLHSLNSDDALDCIAITLN